jgi:hypothetical protein
MITVKLDVVKRKRAARQWQPRGRRNEKSYGNMASSNAAWDLPALSRDIWADYGLKRTREKRVVEYRKLQSKYMPGGNKESHKNSPSGKQTSWSGPLELEPGVRQQDHHGTIFIEPSFTNKLKTHYSSFFEKLVVFDVHVTVHR